MKAFITGSNIYGTLGVLSDLDVVLFCNRKQMDMLAAWSDDGDAGFSPNYAGSSANLRFGSLNLIVHTSRISYYRWLLAKFVCWCKSPVTKLEAKEIHLGIV